MVTVSDDFNRADSVGSGLGANWNSPYGVGNRFDVVSNRAQATGTTTCLVMHATPMTGPDHTVEATYGTGSPVSVIARYDGTGNSDGTAGGYYRFHYNGTTLQLGKKPSGTASVTTIGSAFNVTLVAGDLIKIEVIGTTINGYLNGTLVCSGTDATITTGTRVGMRSATVATNALDNFAAADAVAGGSNVAVTSPAATRSRVAPTPTLDVTTSASNVSVAAPAAIRSRMMVVPTVDTSTIVIAGQPTRTRSFPVPTLDITTAAGSSVTVVAPPALRTRPTLTPVVTKSSGVTIIAAPALRTRTAVAATVSATTSTSGRRDVDFIRFDGSVMRLDRQETEFYDPQPVTVPTLGAWEASFDGGVTWIQPEVLNGRPLWLVTYGGDTSSGATVVPRTNVLPKLRDADNPETLVENGPRIIVV